MAQQILRIATRSSPLALWQAKHVAEELQRVQPDIETQLVKMVTRGDKILDAPLAKVGGKGLFVKELEQGMLDGRADIAVHSMKDVPVEFPDGLHLAAILPREDPCDAFVSTKYSTLSELPANAKIGTSSLRRQCQIKELLPEAQILTLRGNVNTRLSKLDSGEYDAIILAAAGLNRLGMGFRITEKLAVSHCLPAIGQGAIGIECRINDMETNSLLRLLHDQETSVRIDAERAMNARLQGGCQVPIAGYAELQGEQLYLRGLVGSPDGREMIRSERIDHYSQAAEIGRSVADDLLSSGADKILKELFD